jgi:hypothetical protein
MPSAATFLGSRAGGLRLKHKPVTGMPLDLIKSEGKGRGPVSGLEMFILVLLTILCSLAFGDTAPLTFQDWKEQQVLESQNQVLRTSTRISQIKTGKPAKSDSKDASTPALPPNRRVKKTSESDQLAIAEKDQKNAQESLEAARALQFDDYITIYLPTLQDQPEAVDKLAEKLSKDELAEIFKGLIKHGAKTNDTKRSMLEGLAASSKTKAP